MDGNLEIEYDNIEDGIYTNRPAKISYILSNVVRPDTLVPPVVVPERMLKYLSYSYTYEKLLKVSEIINDVSASLSLPENVRMEAVLVAKELWNKGLLDRRFSVNACVSIYVAGRRKGVPVSIDDIANVLSIEKKECTKALYRMSSIYDVFNGQRKTLSPKEFVPQIIGELNLDPGIMPVAVDIIEKTRGLVSGNPRHIAIASIMLALDLSKSNVDKHSVIKALNVSENTIASYISKLKNALGTRERKKKDGEKKGI